MDFRQRDLLQGIDKNFEKQFVDISIKENHKEGMFLFHRGDRAENCYVLLKGRVKLTIGEKGHEVHLVSHAGEVFGWPSIVGKDVYFTSAECMEPTKTIRFEKEKCFKLMARHPDSGMIIFQRLAALLGERLLEKYEELSQFSDADDVITS